MSRPRKQLTKADREKAKKGIRARQDAIKTLLERHREEFDTLHISNRIALGLPPTTQAPTAEKLAERIRKQEEKLAKDRELLRLVS